jgi:hypothetical protein
MGRFSPKMLIIIVFLASLSAPANAQCAGTCPTPVSSVLCNIGVTYSNLPAGVTNPVASLHGAGRNATGTACLSANVICNAAAVAQGICTSMYLGATVTVQYALSTSVIASQACSFSFNWPTCSQTSATSSSLCFSDDINTWETTCQSQSPSASPFSFTAPMTFYSSSGATFNLGNCAGEGLYYLNYCTTNLCNMPGPISTSPTTLGGQCTNSPLIQFGNNLNSQAKKAGEIIGGAIIAAIVIPIVVGVLIIVAIIYCCCCRKKQAPVIVVQQAPPQVVQMAPMAAVPLQSAVVVK